MYGHSFYKTNSQKLFYFFINQVKHFDRKRVYEEYKKKLNSEGFKPTNEWLGKYFDWHIQVYVRLPEHYVINLSQNLF